MNATNIDLNIIAGIGLKIDKSSDNQYFAFNQHCANTHPQLRQAIHDIFNNLIQKPKQPKRYYVFMSILQII